MNKQQMMFGSLPDTNPDKRNYKISRFIPNMDVIRNTKFMLDFPKKEIVMNQENYNACVGHSFILAKQILEYQQTNKWIDFDPFILYGTRYTDDNYDGSGMYPFQGAKVLLKEGAFLRRDFGIREEMPLLKDKVISWKENHKDLVLKAEDYKISGYSFVNDIGSIKISLSNKMPVSAAFCVYDELYAADINGKISLPRSKSILYGYHQMTIVGWTNDCWIVVNSWGLQYGLKGIYLIPFDYPFDSAIAVTDTITPSLKKSKEITIELGRKRFMSDNEELSFSIAPYMKGNVIYAPIRLLAQSLGCSVEWDDNSKEIIIRSEECVMKFKLHSSTVILNNESTPIKLSGSVDLANNDTSMVPVMDICKYLNTEVVFNEDTSSLKIKAL